MDYEIDLHHHYCSGHFSSRRKERNQTLFRNFLFYRSGKNDAKKANGTAAGIKSHPVDTANWFSFMTFSWISPLMFSSYRSGLNSSEIPFISTAESSELNTDLLEEVWKAELKENGENKTRYGTIMWNYVRKRVLLTSIVYLSSVLIGFITPTVCMRQLLIFSSNPEAEMWDGAFWVALLVICEFLRVGLFTLTWALGYRYVKNWPGREKLI